MITIIESGNNIASVVFALERLGAVTKVSNDPDVILNSTHVILPGVGTAAAAMNRLRKANLINVIKNLTQPVLGICVGMQLLFDFSEEGNTECLGLIPGRVSLLKNDISLSVPHMGWNTIQLIKENRLFNNINNHSYVYFVHSYAAQQIASQGLTETCYGGQFLSSVKVDNFYGVQFHPEKSGECGKKILNNFLEL